MATNTYKNYRQADISTADRGKLVIMVYDHCIKWLKKAEEENGRRNPGGAAKALQRVQAGLTELMCSLNMEQGGDIARNLFQLYDFYSRHLSTAVTNWSSQPILDVLGMMGSLREAWLVAIENVRREGGLKPADRSVGLSIVS